MSSTGFCVGVPGYPLLCMAWCGAGRPWLALWRFYLVSEEVGWEDGRQSGSERNHEAKRCHVIRWFRRGCLTKGSWQKLQQPAALGGLKLNACGGNGARGHAIKGYVSKAELANLAKYKYGCVDLSPVSKYVMIPFWEVLLAWCFPWWLAPNLITLIGFAVPVANTVLIAIYCPSFTEEPPSWLYLSMGLGLFFYQTFDGIDGKQARRTGTGSPLGEMFDHGCDALNTSMTFLSICALLRLGVTTPTLVLFLSSMLVFYGSTWQEWHIHYLFLWYFSGPVEGILTIVGLFCATGITGSSDVWVSPVGPMVDMEDTIPDWVLLNHVLVALVGLSGAVTFLSSVVDIVRNRKEHSLWVIFKQGFPMMFVVGLFVAVFEMKRDVLVAHPWLIMQGFGFAFAHMVSRVLVAHLCLTDIPPFPSLLTLPVLFSLNALTPVFFGRPSLVDGDTAALSFFGLTAAWHSHFAVTICCAFADELGVSVLTIPASKWEKAREKYYEEQERKAKAAGAGK